MFSQRGGTTESLKLQMPLYSEGNPIEISSVQYTFRSIIIYSSIHFHHSRSLQCYNHGSGMRWLDRFSVSDWLVMPAD